MCGMFLISAPYYLKCLKKLSDNFVLHLLAEKKKKKKKINCKNCHHNEKSKFDEPTCVFSCRRDLIIFLLDILLNIKKNWWQFCRCELSIECRVCEFKRLYANDKYVIYRNCFNLHFQAVFHRNMYDCLEEQLEIKNHIVCHLISSRFKYTFDVWFTGKQNVFFLQEIVNLFEQKQIEKIKTAARFLLSNYNYLLLLNIW